MRLAMFTIVLNIALQNTVVHGHPGRLNSSGCHNDRQNNSYHCHRGNQTGARNPATNQRRNEQEAGRSNRTYYRNCSAARAAGVTPIRRGEPGYGRHLDRDNDGVACE